MTLDKFTIKAQESVQEAVNTAQRNGQQTIEPVHLLAGIMNKAKDVTNYLFRASCNTCPAYRAANHTSAQPPTAYC